MQIFLVVIGSITCAIIILTIFFSLWSALMRKIKSVVPNVSYFSELPGRVDLILDDGQRFDSVEFDSVLSVEAEFPYGMSELICVMQNGRKIYLKSDSIRVIVESENKIDQSK